MLWPSSAGLLLPEMMARELPRLEPPDAATDLGRMRSRMTEAMQSPKTEIIQLKPHAISVVGDQGPQIASTKTG